MTSLSSEGSPFPADARLAEIRDYWNLHIHDLAIATHLVGTPGFFRELEEYRFDKLHYLPRIVDFSAFQGKKLLEVGCGIGIDLVRFAHGGATVTGVDLAEVSIDLARKYFAHEGLSADLRVMNGEALEFADGSFDVVYAHGVLQYTANAQKMIDELHRVLRPGGQAILMVYNRVSWLNLLSRVMKVELEHEDAPVLRMYSIKQFRGMLVPFTEVRIVPERFPVKTRLHSGIKATLYNDLFVKGFNCLPMGVIRPFGWHLMAFARK
ncbi:MAG: class I SAM-dependent methyltransferase [Anaerolineae bacterium]|nr:class I SAM-dependent methyltransferase [Anaerolineae bacterium]